MRYASVCSGIEAASVAWHPLGWEPAFFAEIAAFPSRVLAHRWPSVANVGDFTNAQATAGYGTADILVGGTPCQSFSAAGRRAGLDDPRGHLAIEFLRIAQRLEARWIVWENVPGVLSSRGGRDFGTFLGCVAELGYGFAYRVLDAQFFGVAQRRRRVFVVGHFGDWRRAAAVLFERACVQGDSRSRDKARPKFAPGAAPGVGVSHALTTRSIFDPTIETFVPVSSQAIAFDSRQITSWCNRSRAADGLPASTLAAVSRLHVATADAVRRMTPLEWERLQGFPDGYTAIPKASDAVRYRAIGNSMAVPVMRWIGERIAMVEATASEVACDVA